MSRLLPHRRVAERPVSPSAYVHGPPRWLLVGTRVAFAVTALLVALLASQGWDTMPMLARVLAAVLSPTLLTLSLWNTPWQRTTKFVADASGMYFPCNDLLIVHLGHKARPEWLHVPWRCIHRLRLAIEAGDDACSCVALDVEVSPEEEASFFAHVGRPRDRPIPVPGLAFAAFSDTPPWPNRTLARLMALQQHASAGGVRAIGDG